MSPNKRRFKRALAIAAAAAAGVVTAVLCTNTSPLSTSFAESERSAANDRQRTDFRSFSHTAANSKPSTDKVAVHSFGRLYDAYFSREVAHSEVKLLEIGLGCGLPSGPGASALIWPKVFPNGEFWFADIDKQCVEEYWNSNMPWRYVIGDQADQDAVHAWVKITGGKFDFIIDDGGHTNIQIWNAFQVLFYQALKPGGTYFVESMHVGRHPRYHAGGIPSSNGSALIDVFMEWADQLATGGRKYVTKLPPEVSRVDCIKEMCAITKL
jgi:hypothetical protein